MPAFLTDARQQIQYAALEELKRAAGDLLAQVKGDQLQKVHNAVEDLAGIGFDTIIGKITKETALREAGFVRSTLTSEATLAALRAEAAAVSAVRAVFIRVLGAVATAAVAA